MVAVIPAYEPDEKLPELVRQICTQMCCRVIVVDDGSGPAYEAIFAGVRKMAVVLTHEKNRGKGQAMKTAVQYVAENNPEEEGIVFADADGQHRIADMSAVADALRQNPGRLVLGSREFSGDVPFKSRMGNKITRRVFRLLSGVSLTDTQTGLRAVSARYIPLLLRIPGERYEYEMNMLLTFAREKIGILEVPIATVYLDEKNSVSHFRAVRDSVRIYAVVLKFLLSSGCCALLDYGLFYLFVRLFGGEQNEAMLIMCNAMARVCSATANFTINRSHVFQSDAPVAISAIRYGILALCILGINSVLLYSFRSFLFFPVLPAKLATEVLLFFFSFILQQRVVFRRGNAY